MDAGQLWQHFHDELFRFVRQRAESDAAAQDLLQQTFLRAHTSLQRGDRPEQPRAWLYQILRNLLIDAQRHAGRQAALRHAAAQQPVESAPDPAEEQALSAAVARSLPRFVDALQEPYRQALRMTDLEGMPQAEAARRAGVSVSGMKSRVQRGRRQVFDQLQRCCQLEVDARGKLIDCQPRDPEDCC